MIWTENFEVATFNDLFNPDLSRWTNYNFDTGNVIELAVGAGRGGGNCLRAIATPPNLKAQIERSFPAPYFPVGSHVWLSMWVKVEVTQPSYTDIFLADIENEDMEGNPGRRIFLRSATGYGNLEGKHAGDTFYDVAGASLATGDWVLVVIHYYLHPTAGIADLWVNGVKRISGVGQTTPDLDSTAHYSRLQVGLTANASAYTQTWLIDDVAVSDQPLSPGTGLPNLAVAFVVNQ